MNITAIIRSITIAVTTPSTSLMYDMKRYSAGPATTNVTMAIG